jgi:hypothetical protein
MKLSIKTNFPEVQAKLDMLREEIATKATARALNATIAKAKTAMNRKIRDEFNLKASTIREHLKIKRATFKAGILGMSAELMATAPGRKGGRLNMIHFVVNRGKGKEGVIVKIKRQGGRKTVKGAFIGNKGRTVFERVEGKYMASRRGRTKHSQQIQPVQTIHVPQMFNTRRVKDAVVYQMRASFPAIFERELAYAISQWKK